MNFIDPASMQLIRLALDASALRHQAIAQNIANANIPGASTAAVEFESHLQHIQADLAAGRHFAAADIRPPQWTERRAGPIELDEQMSALSINSLHYQVLIKAVSRQLAIASLALQEGRR